MKNIPAMLDRIILSNSKMGLSLISSAGTLLMADPFTRRFDT